MAVAKKPRDAKSIADLMQIRAYPENREYLESINENLGTALGFKKKSGDVVSREPAIIVFVPRKIHAEWIDDSHAVWKELSIPGNANKRGIRCSLDVVPGGRAGTIPPEPPLSPENEALVDRLQGVDRHLWCGSQLAVLAGDGRGDLVGTLGAFARHTGTEATGFITNDHVAIGNRQVFHPRRLDGTKVGFRVDTFLKAVDPKDWYGPFAAEPGATDTKVHVDCEFLELHPNVAADRIRPTLPTIGPLGPLFDIDLEADMDSGDSSLIGQRVLKIGRTTGLTRGTIAAFAYEWRDLDNESRYTDLLIKPDPAPSVSTIPPAFSRPGDSGSLVCTEDGLRPIALMWGGRLEQLVDGRAQRNWTYASRLDRILSKLQLELV